MKRMCCDELKDDVRRIVEESNTDPAVAASALRELAVELDPDYPYLAEGVGHEA